jgi:hypothetical protein
MELPDQIGFVTSWRFRVSVRRQLRADVVCHRERPTFRWKRDQVRQKISRSTDAEAVISLIFILL